MITPILLAAAAAASSPLPAPESVFVKNATIWTQGPQGKLEKADLIAKDGKIVKVGVGLTPPAGATVIDGTGAQEKRAMPKGVLSAPAMPAFSCV